MTTEETFAAFRLPRWAELPGFELYMDQVLGLINGTLAPLAAEGVEETQLTKTMINNYVKLKLIRPPVMKKYDRPHLAFLFAVTILKRTFSIVELTDIKRILLRTMSPEMAYDALCDELETTLRAACAPEKASFGTIPREDAHYNERAAIRAIAIAFASKAYAQSLLAAQHLSDMQPGKGRKNAKN